jgi:hypothetical protein
MGIMENMDEKLKTQHWGEVDVDEETYGKLLKLYRNNGIADIVKIAAHIGYEADVEFIGGYGDKTQGDLELAGKLLEDLCNLVKDAEEFDSAANLAVGV